MCSDEETNLPNICPNFAIYKFQLIKVVHFLPVEFDYLFINNCFKDGKIKQQTNMSTSEKN